MQSSGRIVCVVHDLEDFSMSEIDYLKKNDEQERLWHFLEAYEFATGRILTITAVCEAPDFECRDEEGNLVGVELTRLELPSCYIEPLSADDFLRSAIDNVHASSQRKEGLGSDVILVLEIYEGFEMLVSELADPEGMAFEEYYLEEIWLADYEKVEPYGGVELFCLAPIKQYGRYTPPFVEKKPYG